MLEFNHPLIGCPPHPVGGSFFPCFLFELQCIISLVKALGIILTFHKFKLILAASMGGLLIHEDCSLGFINHLVSYQQTAGVAA